MSSSHTHKRSSYPQPTSHPGQTDAGMPKPRRSERSSVANEAPFESGGTLWSDSRPKERPGTEADSTHADNVPVESSSSLEGGSSDAHDAATHEHESTSSVDITPDERGDADPRDD